MTANTQPAPPAPQRLDLLKPASDPTDLLARLKALEQRVASLEKRG